MSKQNEGSAAIHNAVSQLLIDGNVKGALVLANCLHAPGRSITASAVTSPKTEKKVVVKTTKAKVSLVKTKDKAKPKKAKAKESTKKRNKYCANDKTYKVNLVKLNEIEHRIWLGVKSLIDGYEMYLHSAGVNVPALVVRPQITAREVVGAIGGDVFDKNLIAVANKVLNRFEAEAMIVLRRKDVEIKRKTRGSRKFSNLRFNVSIGPAGA